MHCLEGQVVSLLIVHTIIASLLGIIAPTAVLLIVHLDFLHRLHHTPVDSIRIPLRISRFVSSRNSGVALLPGRNAPKLGRRQRKSKSEKENKARKYHAPFTEPG